jgi:hypothetical protein
MKKKKKKSESAELTRQTWDPCHESLIIKQKNLILRNKKKKKDKKKLKELTFSLWTTLYSPQ